MAATANGSAVAFCSFERERERRAIHENTHAEEHEL